MIDNPENLRVLGTSHVADSHPPGTSETDHSAPCKAGLSVGEPH